MNKPALKSFFLGAALLPFSEFVQANPSESVPVAHKIFEKGLSAQIADLPNGY